MGTAVCATLTWWEQAPVGAEERVVRKVMGLELSVSAPSLIHLARELV